MNERIRQLRKSLGLTLENFGQRIGVTKMTISRIENGKNAITDQMFKSICREFNVNEEWLRNGVGSMFNEHLTFSLDDFIIKNGATELEVELAKAYFSMDVGLRRNVIEHFKKYINEEKSLYNSIYNTPEELEASYPPINIQKIKKNLAK